jgi:hypothetical protein
MNSHKLDRRFAGYNNFKYCSEFARVEVQKFQDIRIWCWDTWGPSCELSKYTKLDIQNPAWCWASTEWYTRIYFATDAEYSWFLLKWGTE